MNKNVPLKTEQILDREKREANTGHEVNEDLQRAVLSYKTEKVSRVKVQSCGKTDHKSEEERKILL